MEMELGKLFIGGISWDTNEGRLREYFQAFGEVLEAVIMKDRTTGRARGFGFVVFADPAVAERVVLEKHLIDGRNVEAKKAVPREDQNILNRNNSSIHGPIGATRTKKIFVGGLASTVTEGDFKNYFDQFGIVTDVVVMYDHNTQRPRGFGFITYDSEEAVDKVLQKTFHELNGKMVEVKRAVPKELSPVPIRAQLGAYNYSPSRLSNFLNSYTQGYTPSSVGGYGIRMDGRFSPVNVSRSNFSPSYGMGLNFEQGFSPSYGGNLNFGSNLGSGRLSPSYGGNSSRYGSPIGYGGSSGGSNSVLNSTARSLWGHGNISHASNSSSANYGAFMDSKNSAMNSFGNIRALWGSSANSGQAAGSASAYSSGSLSYSSGDFNAGLGVGFGRNSNTSVAPVTSHTASDGGYDRAYSDVYENGSYYGDSTWRSSPLETDRSGSFGLGLGNATSDIVTKSSTGYVGGYSVADRQSNRGIAA